MDPARQLSFTTAEGTWISVDVSPDGQHIVFDLMGDIYRMPFSGGKAEPLTKGMAYDVHPTYSPDGSKILFISDRTGSDNAYVLDLESMEVTQMTQESTENMVNGDWSPAGELFVVAKGRRNFKLQVMHEDGGQGTTVVDEPSNLKAIDPEFSANGQKIYYSRRNSGGITMRSSPSILLACTTWKPERILLFSAVMVQPSPLPFLPMASTWYTALVTKVKPDWYSETLKPAKNPGWCILSNETTKNLKPPWGCYRA